MSSEDALGSGSDKDALIKKLESEKKQLLDKNKGLAEILELSAAGAMGSPAPTAPAQPAFDPKIIESAIESKFSEFKKDISSLDKKLSASHEKKEPIVTPQQLTDLASKFAAVEDRLKALDKISDVEKKITDLETTKKAADEEKDGLFGDMSAFEEQATSSIFGKAAAPRSMRAIDISLKKLDEVTEARFRHMDKKVEDLERRLSPRALRTLEKLAISGDRIVHELVPSEVKGEVDKIVNAFSFEVRGLSDTVKKLAEDTERLNSDTKSYTEGIEGIGARLKSLEAKFDGMERDSRMLEAMKHEVESIKSAAASASALPRDNVQLKTPDAREELEQLLKNGIISKEVFEEGMRRLSILVQH